MSSFANIARFISTRCYVCAMNGTAQTTHDATPGSLKRCSRCRLISYCGAHHQSQDLFRHRPFCRAVGTLLRSARIEYPHDLNGSVVGVRPARFQRVAIELKTRLDEALRRPLTDHERASIEFPRVCCACYAPHIDQLTVCPRCRSVSVCTSCTLSEHSHPAFECEQLSIYALCLISPDIEVYAVRPQPPDQPDPADDDTLFALVERSLVMPRIKLIPTTNADLVPFAAASNFSFVATLAFALRRSGLFAASEPVRSRISVHIIGASSEVVLFTEGELNLLWIMLLVGNEHQAAIRTLDLLFVGPDIPGVLDGSTSQLPTGRSKTRIRFVRSRYTRALAIERPNLCVAFNAGISESNRTAIGGLADDDAHNPWTPAIERVLANCSRFAFTGYTENERLQDLRCVLRIGERCPGRTATTVYSGRNPYRDMRPHRNPTFALESKPHERIYFINGYISVLHID